MFSLKEKLYLLELLKKQKRKSLFRLSKTPPEHASLVEKLEQMVRNEQVNHKHL